MSISQMETSANRAKFRLVENRLKSVYDVKIFSISFNWLKNTANG
jgi:hypothetical protein